MAASGVRNMRQQKNLLMIFVIGVAIRIGLATWGGHSDVQFHYTWGDLVMRYRLINTYAAEASEVSYSIEQEAIYPPLSLLSLGAAYSAHHTLSAILPATASYGWRLVFIKLPAILADTAIAGLVWFRGRRQAGAGWIAAAIMLNPALIYLSAVWGQIDSLYVLCAVAAALLATTGNWFLAGACLAASIMFKVQGIVIMPVLGLILAAHSLKGSGSVHDRLKGVFRNSMAFASGLLLILAACVGPFVLNGQGPILLKRLFSTLSTERGWITINALNFWYLIVGNSGNVDLSRYYSPVISDTAVFLLGQSYRAIGQALTVVGILTVSIVSIWKIPHRSITGWMLTGALFYLSVFLFSTRMHERYSIAVIPFLAAGLSAVTTGKANWRSATLWGLLSVTSVLQTLNLLWSLPLVNDWSTVLSGNQVYGMVISAGYIACFCGMLGLITSPDSARTAESVRPETERERPTVEQQQRH